MLKYKSRINLSNLLVFFLSIFLCLWSTTWKFFNIIPYSYLFYIYIIFISSVIYLYFFKLRDIQRPILIFLFFFSLFNTSYFIIALYEYSISGENLNYLFEYFVKQNVCIIFCLLFSQYLFSEKNLDNFFKIAIYSYILILSYLIYVYIFIFRSDFIGVIVDYEFGRTRSNKNTLGIFLTLIFPFILTYILKTKSFFIGSIFLFIYFFFIYKVDSSTVVIISVLQLFFYFFILFKKFYLKLILLFTFLFFLFPNYIIPEFEKSSKNLSTTSLEKNENDYEKSDLNKKPFLVIDSHRGRLLYSGIEKIKKDLFVGSGTQTFRIREDNFGSKTETHNTYVAIMVDYGIFGFFLYVFFYFFLFTKIFKKKKIQITNYDSSCLIYILSLLSCFNFINIEYTLSIWLLNGICLTRAFSENNL